MKKWRKQLAVSIAVILAVFLGVPALASITDGTIDTTEKWAWGSKIGWINFGATQGNVHITDTALTGYAWNDLYGWINLNPAQGGVNNTNEGILSGYAWNSNLGWIDFTGVVISTYGVFVGAASGDNTGLINFSCANCSVKTDWRPVAARPTEYPVASGMPGGSTASPQTSAAVSLNSGAAATRSREIVVSFACGADGRYAWLSENSSFAGLAEQAFCSATSTISSWPFTLSEGEGLKTIYVKICNASGYCSEVSSDSILYAPSAPLESEIPPPPIKPKAPPAKELTVFEIVKKTLAGILGEIIPKKLPSFKIPKIPIAKFITEELLPGLRLLIPGFKPAPVPMVPLEKLVAKVAPPAFSGRWELVPRQPVREYVFAPLPQEFIALAAKFPQVSETFAQVGIRRLNDIQKLGAVKMNLPGLTRAVTLKIPGLAPGVSAPKAIPLGQLSPQLKKQLPPAVVFTRGAGELVDFNVALTLSEQGRPMERINTISGKRLELAVKPDWPVDMVKGYFTFKSRKIDETQRLSGLRLPFSSAFASLFFAQPVLAREQEKPVRVEERLVLKEFDYADPDRDGIYTASVEAPVPEGQYEIITVLHYKDRDLGVKEIRMIAVVDPEGYIYEKINEGELRVKGAVATLYWLNPASKRYEVWPARDYSQDNPQVTDAKGTYSFLVPEGMYYLNVTAPGYLPYDGKPFEVREGGGVHFNIEMKTKYWWLDLLDWRTALIIVVALLLLYNFYKDRKRERVKK